MEKLINMLKTKAPITIVGVLVIGVVCSAIYDALVKPGFSIVSRVLFDFFTFGSQSVKDYTFSNAALDPTSLPAMFVMLMGGAYFIARVLKNSFSLRLPSKPIAKDEAIQSAQGESTLVDQRGQFSKPVEKFGSKIQQLKRLRLVVWFMDAIVMISVFIIITTTNQSILVWRVYNANIKIVTPYLQADQIQTLNSKFSRVKTEGEYKAVLDEMNALADKHQVQLRNDSGW